MAEKKTLTGTEPETAENKAAERPALSPDRNPTLKKMQQRGPQHIDDCTFFYEEREDRDAVTRKNWEDLLEKKRKGVPVGAMAVETRIDPAKGKIYIVGRINDDFTVLVPVEEFFGDWSYNGSYRDADDAEQFGRRAQKARACLGAWFSFMILGTDRSRNEDGGYTYTVVGSRLAALKVRQEHFFSGKNQPAVGDTATAEVISVGEHLANIEVLGVECAVNTTEIDAFTYVSDCRDMLKPGDRLDVAIKQIGRKADGSISLKVSGAYYGNEEARNSTGKLKKGNIYMGTVRNYNREKDIYTIILDIKALVSVRGKDLIGCTFLSGGQRVSVTVYNILPHIAFGNAKRV